MPTSTKRTANQQQSQPEDEEYDEYVYHSYYPKSVPGGGYEYVPEPQQNKEYEQSTVQYYEEPVSNNNPSMQRT